MATHGNLDAGLIRMIIYSPAPYIRHVAMLMGSYVKFLLSLNRCPDQVMSKSSSDSIHKDMKMAKYRVMSDPEVVSMFYG